LDVLLNAIQNLVIKLWSLALTQRVQLIVNRNSQLTDAITHKINFNTQTVPKLKRPGVDDPERSTTTHSQRNFNDDQWKNHRRDSQLLFSFL